MLRRICLQLLTDVSRQPMRPILNGQAVQDYQRTLRNIAEERRPRLHRGGSLKRKEVVTEIES